MFKIKNKLSLVLMLLAIFCFAGICVGGEFFHAEIHHHQDKSSHDQCFITQLQAQVLIFLPVVILALFVQVAFRPVRIFRPCVVLARYNLPPLRAPPVSLS